MNERTARLQQFFAGYFNQDWDLGGAASWSEVVDEYLAQNPPADVRVMRDDLRAWLAESDGRLPPEFGCDYDPRPDGMDERQWVCAIADHIEQRISD
jgi:hypothetical protein